MLSRHSFGPFSCDVSTESRDTPGGEMFVTSATVVQIWGDPPSPVWNSEP